jgi:DNA primase
MRFSKEWIQQLKTAIPLHEVVSENVNLRKSGRGFMGLCPFHGERSASFSVGTDFYHCFGCKASGDIIKFMMELHGLSFEEACEELAERASLALPVNTLSDEAERAQAQRRARIQKAARLNHFVGLKYYHAALISTGGASLVTAPQISEAREYLKKRSITDQTIQNFQIGVAGAQPDSLVQFLTTSKAPLDLAREYGLIRPSQKHTGDYDFFRERLLFPLIDARGRVCGFGGRILPEAEKSRAARGEVKLPKYLNSSESELFQKSKFLYGLFQAKRAIRETETVIVVEGYFDTVALHQAGFQNVVATCGTTLTEDHLKTLTRLAKKVIVFFDQDEAGISATTKAVDEALKLGIVVYGVPFTSKQDPDEFVHEHGAPALQALFERAYPLLDHLIETQMKASEGNLELRSQAIKEIVQRLQLYQDPVGRSLRAQDLRSRWSVPVEALGGLLAGSVLGPVRGPAQPPLSNQQSHPQQQRVNSQQAQQPNTRKRTKLSGADRELIHFLARFDRYGEQFYQAKLRLPEKDSLSVLFDDTEAKAWVESLASDPAGFTRLKEAPEACIPDSISQELRMVILEGVLMEPLAGSESQLDALLYQANKKVWAQFSQGIRRQMVEAETRQDIKKFEELSKQFLDLQKNLKELEASYVAGKNNDPSKSEPKS